MIEQKYCGGTEITSAEDLRMQVNAIIDELMTEHPNEPGNLA